MSLEGVEPLTGDEWPATVEPKLSHELGERDRIPVLSAEQIGERIRLEGVREHETGLDVERVVDQVLELGRDYSKAIGQQTPHQMSVR